MPIAQIAEHRFSIYTNPLAYANLHHNREKTKWVLSYHIGGLVRNGFQNFSFSVRGKQTEFQLYTQQASALSPNQRYGLH